MKLKELIEGVREIADDTVAQKYLWPTKFIVAALNEGEVEACRRARLIIDSSTAATCRLTMALATSTYSIDPRVIFIRRVKLSTQDVPLGFARVRDMDTHVPGWEAETGQIVAWCPDFTTGKVRFYRTPTADELPATVNLTVVREPLKPMSDLNDCPEIKPRYHPALQDWALYRMYGKRDTELYNPQASAGYLEKYEAEFGKRSSALDEQWIDANFDYNAEIGVF